jgi:outer membrane receptor protein involved in Fe transport
VENTCFLRFRRQPITLDANQNVRVDAPLTVGSINESITVNAEAPLVDSRSSVMGTLIDGRRLTELPTNGRNVISLAALLPGVSDVSTSQTFTGDRSGATVSMSGTKGNFNLFLFNGQDYEAVFRNTGLNYPPPDALQEVKVLTSSFSAEYGHNAFSRLPIRNLRKTSSAPPRADQSRRTSCLCSAPMKDCASDRARSPRAPFR